jgi:two-component system response regulator AlgR
MVEALSPDLILLDISMPGLDGMTTAAKLRDLPRPPAVVFVTAFDRFAVAAFDIAATDYLLKPVSPERLARAIVRVAQVRETVSPPPHVDEFWVPHRTEMIRIAAIDIDRIDAERDYMRLTVGARSWLIHDTITALEQRLDPEQFIRLHRSTIVRRDRIRSLRHDGLGSWYAELVDESSVRIGRTYLPAVRTMIGR